jgi:FtsP/CotA-like multicopper oxidase with cupredoxin domain
MHKTRSLRFGRGKAIPLSLSLLAMALVMCALPRTAKAQAVGVACTTSSSPTPSFTLDATEGYIQLPDGNTMYMWGYAKGGQAFQHPGPVLCVNEGDNVTVVLRNYLPGFVQPQVPDGVSIMFPGQVGVKANGVPAQPQFNPSGVLTSLTNATANTVGSSVTYTFTAGKPGSYIYESGTDPNKQVRMGLFGALIVRPSADATNPDPIAKRMNGRDDSKFTPSEEFMVLLSEIDPYQHQAEEFAYPFDMNTYHPRYWLINGRGFPDSISDNFASFLPDQPYGALARIRPYDDRVTVGGQTNPAYHPHPGAIRYLNVGTEEFPYHPHGNNGRVIGRDGSALAGPGGQDLSMEKFAINIGPSQTWDVIFDWRDAESYTPTNVPVTIPQVNNQEFGIFYSGSPFLGQTGPLPPGASTLNECGAYYIISHNHALFQMSSWGVNATGPITYVRVDPPKPACP